MIQLRHRTEVVPSAFTLFRLIYGNMENVLRINVLFLGLLILIGYKTSFKSLVASMYLSMSSKSFLGVTRA